MCRMLRRGGAIVLVGVLLVVLAACSGHSAPRGSYAALGDSYAAGMLTGAPIGSPRGCLRSAEDYPHVVQGSLHAATFTDVSCTGATTADALAAESVPGGQNPPQADAVSASTTLVTLTLGGNDIGFDSILEHCASLVPVGTPCKDHYDSNGVDQLAARVAATAPKIGAVLAALRQRAPQARLLVVGYPDLLPVSGGCWPDVPFTNGDASYLNGVEVRLNAMLAEQATAAGARFVDVYTASIGHDMCTPTGTRWVEPLLPTSLAAPFHLNATGEAQMAAAVLAVATAPASS